MRTKIGDTLVEVALAIGIFSMVAIVIVSVISASTSNAQTALEVTISREDLDAQAEALRFIHDSYVNDSQSEDRDINIYNDLWIAITGEAVPEEELNWGITPQYEFDFNPSTCSDLYDPDSKGELKESIAGKHPFIINIRNLGGTKNEEDGKITIQPKDILIDNDNNVFYEATTFPRIIYGESGKKFEEDSDFYSQTQTMDEKTDVKRVEGIYIIATRGKYNIVTANDDVSRIEGKDAYFDFSIRSCWFPPGAKRASTISTTIRLYDPAVIEY